MAYKYLDATGLALVWQKIKNNFDKNVIEGIQLNGTTITPSSKIVNIEISDFSGASASSAGTNGLVPAPALGQQEMFLRGDGHWAAPVGSTYAAGTGLSLSGTTFNHANSITAASVGPSSSVSGSTVAIPYITFNNTGHITAASTKSFSIPTATEQSAGLMSAEDKTTLDGLISTGGEPNQNAFSNITVGSSTVAADSKTDTFTLVGQGSVTLSANTSTDTITITGTNTTYAASTSSPLMDGTAAVGTSTSYARGDHRHPTDTSRAPLASPQFTGTPGAPTAAAGTASTQIATTAFVDTAITNALADITGIEYEIVQSLPASGEAGVIYLVSNNGTAPNIYDEYIWTGTSFEKIGTTDVDLSGYVKTTDLVAITSTEIDTICV